MENSFIEKDYPLDFRKEDAEVLGDHIRLRHSVELVGTKRVGISNFLRFFLYHKDIVKTYVNHGEKHLFIPVDLNDLVQLKIFPFWILTFKRLVDCLDHLPNNSKLKKTISDAFLGCIQSGNLFLTVDSIRQALTEIVKIGVIPTIFFIRFDRLKNVVTEDLFANLQGLIEATNHQLSYVFTGVRPLDQLAPKVFSRASLTAFSHVMYIKPASKEDMEYIFDTFNSKYKTALSGKELNSLITLSGGHVQYLHLCLILFNELSRNENNRDSSLNNAGLKELVEKDERINMQSEEVWDSLTRQEQAVLRHVVDGFKLTTQEKKDAAYLWDSGIVWEKDNKYGVFSSLFSKYLKQNHHHSPLSDKIEFTKKESDLFNLLYENIDQVCERDLIINKVWPEYEELGVSDWTIDRLVARLRFKLKSQGSHYHLITIKTRGYKLTSTEGVS